MQHLRLNHHGAVCRLLLAGAATLVLIGLAACSPAAAPAGGPQPAAGDARSGMPMPLVGEAGPPALPSQPEGTRVVLSPEEAARQAAEQYAASQGVSVEEAERRLSLQDAIGKLSAELEANEQATFAGLWIQNQPDYRVVVRFTEGGEATMQRYTAGGPLAGLVEVRPARWTLAELSTVQAEVTDLAIELGVLVTAGVDVMENRVELGVTDAAKLEAGLQQAGRQLPESVHVSEVQDLPQTLPLPLK